MKKNIGINLVLSVIVITSFVVIHKNNFNMISRSPANFMTGSCIDSVRNVIGDNSVTSLMSRYKRTELLQKAMQEGDLNRAMEILKSGLDNNNPHLKPGDLLRGRSLAKEKKLTKLRSTNRSLYVPAYFQTSKSLKHDTFSTIINVVDKSKGISAQEREAIDDIYRWLDYYDSFWKRVEDEVRQAIEAAFIATHIKGKYFSGSRQLKESDFKGKAIVLDVPFLTETGGFEFSPVSFNSMERLKAFLKEKDRIRGVVFSSNLVDEFQKNSRVYGVYREQALMHRRLELVHRRLSEMGIPHMDKEQKDLLEMLEDVLYSRPELLPNSYMVKWVQDKEIWAERKAMWRFWRSKRVQKDAKYNIPDRILKEAQGFSPYGLWMRGIAAFGSFTFASGGAAAMLLPTENMPQFQYYLAALQNYINDFRLEMFGRNKHLRACAEAERGWTLKEQSAMNDFIKAHTSRYRYLSRIDKNYDYNTDKKLQARERELRALCIKERHEFRLSEGHARNIEEMEVAYRDAVDSMLIDLIDAEHPKGAEIKKSLVPLLDFETYDESNDEQKSLLENIKKVDSEFYDNLKIYRSKVDTAAKTLEQIGSLPKFNSLPEFIEKMDKRYTNRGTLENYLDK